MLSAPEQHRAWTQAKLRIEPDPSSTRGVDVSKALAGTGKTTMIGALAASYRLGEVRVIGAAPTGRAARRLRNDAGIPAGTMRALLAELDRTGGFNQRTVLVLD